MLDFGESHYVYKPEGALPAGSEVRVNDLIILPGRSYFHFLSRRIQNNQTIQAASTEDIEETMVFWYRSHSKYAVASDDPLPPPTDPSWPDDNLQIVAILKSPGTVVVHSVSDSQSFTATPGFNEFILEGFSEGDQSV